MSKSSLTASEKKLLDKSREGFKRAAIIHQLEGKKEVSGNVSKYVDRDSGKILKPSDPDFRILNIELRVNSTGMPADPKTINSLVKKGFLKSIGTLNIRAWGNNRDVEEFEFK